MHGEWATLSRPCAKNDVVKAETDEAFDRAERKMRLLGVERGRPARCRS